MGRSSRCARVAWSRWASCCLAVGVLLMAAPALAGPCTGKANGLWCDGSNLVTCKSGGVTATQGCPSGCQSNPPGVADQCKTASGPCAGKANGAWCNGNDLMNCQGGSVASSQNCANGCQSNPAGVADVCKSSVPQGFCTGKADGAWCDGSDLKQCKGGNVASSQNCPSGCQQNAAGTADACKASTQQGFCSGKADGAWCDGSDLKQCKGGSVASSQSCPSGCQQNAAGTADSCKSSVPQGFCSGKPDGAWCDGGDLKQCQGGNVASSTACKAGCQVNPPGTADACKSEGPPPTGFCAGKADGGWCNGNSLVQCVGGNVDGSKGCPLGCQKNSAGKSDACKTDAGPAGACAGKANGAWCSGSDLVTCNGGVLVASQACAVGCQQNPAGVADACKSPGDTGGCASQSDGQWCQGGALVQCKGGAQLAAMSCASGCLAMGGSGKATCAYKSKGFCAAKADGAWCDGTLLSTCQGGKLASAFACPKGCAIMPDGVPDQCKPDLPVASSGALSVADKNGCAVFSGGVDLWADKGLQAYDQKAYPDELGTCPGLSIHSSGCTITALSMLHEYLGLDRTVDGKSGHTPDLENAWRKGHEGYGFTKYDGKSGNCLVIWGKTAGGLVPAPHHNDSGTCLTVSAAKAIATSLNAGMPTLASVHWTGGNPAWYGGGEDWHWVLVVGADSQGLLINDPWGGKAQIRLQNGALGSYVVDTIYTFFFAPGSGNFEQAAMDETGEPMTEDKLPNSLEQIPGDGVDPRTGSGVDSGSSAGDGGAVGQGSSASSQASSGCSSRPTGTSTAAIWLLLGVVGWLGRRRFQAVDRHQA
jgi:uncharacterized protein YvpB